MNSIILQIASRYIKWIFIAIALIALIRGHNDPGGGFIGGLLASLAFIFKGFAYSFYELKQQLKRKPDYLISGGLALVLASFVPSVLNHQQLMKGVWIKPHLPFIGELKLGTPLIFDIGVFFVVIGITFVFMTSLTKDK